jgi:phosphatidylserine/phosphatidylglycerophosphate/cardiolipin synthase-like enzyme
MKHWSADIYAVFWRNSIIDINMRQRTHEMIKRYIAYSHYVLIFLIVSLVLTACALQIPDLSTLSPVPALTATGATIDRLQIYFTDPSAAHARDYRGGPDEILADDIDQARLSVDVAAYSLDLWSIRDALIHAHQRGVVVRMVMESDNMDNQEIQKILDAGIQTIGDQHEGLMHNKFIVIDQSVVWTGSMNFTVGGAYRDNNNLIRIQSSKVAEDYSSEFDEMFTYHLFGPDVFAATKYPKVNVDGTPVEVYFSPDDHVAEQILALIQNAQESIYFLAYVFTSNQIGEAIMERAQAGVKVEGVMDGSQITSSQGTEYDPFRQAGLDVRLDGNEIGLMHHKVIIIDKSIVITGSYNFTASAEANNDENVVIIFNPVIAGKYMEEFQRVYKQAQKPTK